MLKLVQNAKLKNEKNIKKGGINFEFQGFIEVPFDSRYSYFAHTNENRMYLAIFFRKDRMKRDETFYLKEFIKKQAKFLSCSEEEIKENFLPDINFDTYREDYPFVLYFQGCDDGSYYFRFKSQEKREKFLKKCLTLKDAEEIFNYTHTNLIIMQDN